MASHIPGKVNTSGIEALLNPRNVAIVGARDRPGSWADRIRGNLRRFGYQGQVFAVNPRHTQLWGEACYPSLAELPESPDHLVVLVPAAPAVEMVGVGAALGARSATLFSSGFNEEAALLEQLSQLSSTEGIALSGPNCLGNISVPSSLVTTTDSRLAEIRDGPIAIVGQSGGVVTALNRALVNRGIGSRYMVSSGNETCLTTADYMRYFAEDEGIGVVVAFVESVRNREAFLRACDALTVNGKRLVALKVGQTAESRSAAASHTGALAGSFAAFQAVAGAHGVVSVNSIDQAVEACEFLSRAPAPTKGKVAVITVSGGVRELVLDNAAAHSLPLADFSEDTRAKLASITGPGVEVSNPLDTGYAGLSDPRVLVQCVETAAADGDVGLVLLQEELLGRPDPKKEATLRLFDDSFAGGVTRNSSIPVGLFSMASVGVTEFGRRLRGTLPNLAFLQATDKALGTISLLLQAAQISACSTADPECGSDATNRRKSGVSLLAEVSGPLTEVEAKRLTALYGFITPREAHVLTPSQGKAWAETSSGPFVVKLVSREVTHKSDIGGVILNVPDPQGVEAACWRLKERNGIHDGFLVAEQVNAGVELVIGFVRDPEMGPVVMVGTGGTGVELFGDVAFAPVPCSLEEAVAALNRTKAATLLGPWRGGAPADVRKVAGALCSMARLAAELGDVIESAEINPLVVRRDSSSVVALDALVVRSAQDCSPE